MSYETPAEPIYKFAPTTDRDAGLLAMRHRFDNLESLIEFLPDRAHVLDVGAGLSNLGVEAARSRSDIHWTNFDYSYNDPSILGRAQADAPENMSFVAGDVTHLSETYPDEEFDAVFSYWMFPHLSIDDRLPAEKAACQIYRAAKQTALISIGPKTDKRLFPLFHEKESIRMRKSPMVDENEFAEKIAFATKLGPFMCYVQRIDNEVGTQTLGTTAGLFGDGLVPRIYDQQTDTYVSPFSRIGALAVGKFAMAAGRYIANNPRQRSRSRLAPVGCIDL